MKDFVNKIKSWSSLKQNNEVKRILNNLIDDFFNSKWSVYLILFTSSLIVLPNIGRESFWLDEIFSATATLKVSSLYLMFTQYISKDGNPPLYYILLFFWEKIVGSSDIGIRLLSYIFTLLGFILSYLLLKKYFTTRIAVLFLLLSSFSPSILFFAQEARMYALLYALACLASIVFFVFIIRIRNNQKIEGKLILYYFFIGSFICYTHHFGSLLIFSISVVTIVYSLLLKRFSSTLQIFIVSFFIGIIGISWIVFQFYYVNMGNHIKTLSWHNNNIIGIILNFSTLLALNKYGVASLLILLLPFFLKFNSFLLVIKKYSILLLPFIVLFLLAYVISLKIFIISERYLIVVVPLILLFLSLIFNEFYSKKKQYVFLYLIGLMILSSYYNFTYQKQNWRDASKYIENNVNSSNCVVPIRALSDGSFDRSMFVSYYLGSKYSYSSNGPIIQNNCDVIYIDGHTNKEEIRKTLIKYDISIPVEILNFNKVFIVVKKR
jgi:uncharacterized membrane protein